MSTLREAISDSVRNFLCVAAETPDPFRNWLANATSSIPGVGAVTGGVDSIGDAVASISCPGPGPSDTGSAPTVTYPPGFEPGQCDLVSYRIDYRIEQANGVVIESFFSPEAGPIGGPVIQPVGNGSQVLVLSRGPFSPFNDPDPPNTPRPIFTDVNTPVVSAEFTNITRNDGQPDDCGEQIPVAPTGDDTITYLPPVGPPVVDEPITIIPDFPIIGPGGGLRIPIGIGLPGLDVTLEFNVSTGDINFNFGGQPGGEDCCPPVDDVEEEQDDDDPPPPDDDRRLWGVKVNALIGGPGYGATEVNDGSGPSLFWPDLGFVRFAIQVGGRTGWTDKVAIQTLSQFVPVNAPATAYDYDIYERPGVTLNVKEVIVTGSDTNG